MSLMLINWAKYILDLLPIALRRVYLYNIIRVLLQPIIDINELFLKYKQDVEYKLAHTSQVGSIENVLNDSFDTAQRRIYIEDVGGWEIIIINLDDDQLPILILDLDEDESVVLLQPDSLYEESEFDFIVVLPFSILSSEIYKLNSLVDMYKLPGMRYDKIVT